MSDHITVKLPNLPAYPSHEPIKGSDMFYVWNAAAGQLQHANVNQLPFGSGSGGGVVTMIGSPFKVNVESEQVSLDDGNTIISDSRLLGKSGYPINTTQLNNSTFRNNEVVYDAENGTVTILDFVLQSSEEISLFPEGVSTAAGGGNLQPILDRLASLEAMVAPFVPLSGGSNYARVWWTGGIDTIPVGWIEDTTWRDYTPIHANSASQIGTTTGGNTHTLQGNQQGSFDVRQTRERSGGTTGVRQIDGIAFKATGASSWSEVPRPASHQQWGGSITIGLSNASQSFNLVQKSKFGIWIKYIGV